ncbi:MAG: GC-type dockerin domain-anchored protein, partial [Planctomycetota bacterium]
PPVPPPPALDVVQIVRVSNIFGPGPRLNWLIPTSRQFNPVLSRGYTGMDYYPGTDFGLIASNDWQEIVGGANQFLRYDIDTQENPILLAPDQVSPPPQRRGVSGPAWDLGVDTTGDGIGDGIDFFDTGLGNPDGVIDADGVVGVLDATFEADPSGDPDAIIGIYGYDKDVLDMTVGAEVYSAGNKNGPQLVPVRGDSFWYDLDIHPDGRTIASRGSNDLIISTRDEDQDPGDGRLFGAGEVTNSIRVDEFSELTVGQHCAILHNICEGVELIVYNDRPDTASGVSFNDSVKFVDFAGNPVAVTFVNPDNSPVDISPDFLTDLTQEPPPQILTGAQLYDFSWDEPNQRLAIVDFQNRLCYIFEVRCPNSGGCALADITATGTCDPAGGGDGQVDLSDFSCFLSEWSNSTALADITTTGTCDPGNGGDGVDLSDFSCYLSEWSGGCDGDPGTPAITSRGASARISGKPAGSLQR